MNINLKLGLFPLGIKTKKTVLLGLFFLITLIGKAQGIIVDDQSYSAESLAELLMSNGCMELSNISYSSSSSVAYFEDNGSDFPLEEGVMIRTGQAKYSEGVYTGDNLSSTLNNDSDPFLEEINNADGQPTDIMDVAYIEFDFIPLSNNLQFNFLFASNEYGEWQCLSSDVFAFLITNLDTEETENIALVPGTSTPVSVKNIRDNAVNPDCSPQNEEYFDVYNEDNPGASSVNMKGYTQVMTASSSMIPGDSYRVRLVIGDANDADFDSAVFMEAGSFDASINLGADQTICSGEETVLTTGLSGEDYIHTWKKDGVTLPETGSSLTVTEPGIYEVIVTKEGTNCDLTDEVVIQDLEVEQPEDLSVCDSGEEALLYNLTHNNAAALGLDTSTYEVVFYASQQDAENDTSIPNDQWDSYSSTPGTSIYLKIHNTDTDDYCTTIYSFELTVNPAIVDDPPQTIELCYNESGYVVDLTQVEGEILENQPYPDLGFEYYSQDPMNGGEALGDPEQFELSAGFGSTTMWVRVSEPDDESCYIYIEFEIIEHPQVPVGGLEDVIECEYYELPEIEDGEYYTEPYGEGTHLYPGDIIDEEGTYYIYNGDTGTGCSSQNSFEVTFLMEYDDPEGTFCGDYTIPTPPDGEFYTEPGGPEGEGELIPAGTIINTTTTVYYYAEVDGEFCRDDAMEIIIHEIPDIDHPDDVIICDSYTLPALGGGDYYTAPDGGGEQLSAGDEITSSQQLYVYADDGTCSNESSFNIYIITEYDDVEACGEYVIPEVETGGFYTEAQGQGQALSEGTVLTESQEVYYYVQTTEGENCTEEMSFYITIYAIPEVDSLEDVMICDGDEFVLPELEFGSYFTESGREGEELMPGDILTTSQEIFINNEENNCQNETSFELEVFDAPEVSLLTDVYTCDPYEVPNPTHGEIYTEPGGQGEHVLPGTIITDTQTFYIYNELEEEPYCSAEESFTVTVNYTAVGSFDDVEACDYYVLPELTRGDYFTETNGEGDQLEPGDTISESQTLFVFARKGDRFVCKDEDSFEITISETPELPEFEDIVVCQEYELPPLDDEEFEEYDIDYYLQPGGETPIAPDDYLFGPGEYTIYVHASSPDNSDCYDEKSFNLIVSPFEEIDIEDAVICVDSETGEALNSVLLESGVNPDIYTIEWYAGEELLHTGPDYVAEEGGDYTIIATKIGEDNGYDCDYEPYTVQVREASQPIIEAHVTADFSDVATITVEIVSGPGYFVYSLDGAPYQGENVFHDVESGSHTVYVKDIEADCGVAAVEVEVVKFPKFFTPNADGIHDTWNIKDLESHPDAVVYIFDRYGKLLKIIQPAGEGWDGNFHGKPMPSNDYWFKVEYKVDGETRAFKSHFTLKR